MAVDNRQQMTALPYDHMRYNPQPHYTNPWVSGAASGHMYATTHDQSRQPTSTMAYPQSSLPSLAMPQGAQPDQAMYQAQNSHLQAYAPRPYGNEYPAYQQSQAAPHFVSHDYSAQHKVQPYSTFQDRRPSHPLQTATEGERTSFNDALDASRGMVAMSQDITPRNIYGAQSSNRSSIDSYGFPSTNSNASSISSASSYGTYYGSSVGSEASYGDYAAEADLPNRTLPRPSGLAGMPPAPQSMMGSFSSKVASSSQKKHKCKICDKRFTRPSSLQTHMYSHTGEKREYFPNCLFDLD